MYLPCPDPCRHGATQKWKRDVLRVVTASVILISLGGCERETREFSPPRSGVLAAPPIRQTAIQPSQAADDIKPTGQPVAAAVAAHYEKNAYSASQGKRLYRWYNCSSCHAPGGGGDWGPALSDDQWIYGSSPAAVYTSIVEGRPNGMPSFGAHIPEDQLWQLVAYVRSLSGQLRKDVAPSRSDALQAAPAEATRDRESPVQGPSRAPAQ